LIVKVKLFWKNNPLGAGRIFSTFDQNAQIFEEEINQWLRDHSDIRIIEIKQSASGGSFSPSLWLISVWYEESRA